MRLLGLVLNTNFTQSGVEMSKYNSFNNKLISGHKLYGYSANVCSSRNVTVHGVDVMVCI